MHAEINDEYSLIPVMENLIEDGHPVIYFGLSVDINPDLMTNFSMEAYGHAMVAFDTFTNSDGKKDIKLHEGYNQTAPFTSVRETEYKYVNSIIWLDINEDALPHVCNNNYVDEDNDRYVCSCYIYSNTHPGHMSHKYEYDMYDSDYHWDECFCGARDVRIMHQLNYVNESNVVHLESCSNCGYTGCVPHEYTSATYLSDTLHNIVCECGNIGGMNYHSAGAYQSFGRFSHKVYCICGYYIGVESHSMVDNGRVAYCTDCGAMFDSSSDVIIKGGKENENVESK